MIACALLFAACGDDDQNNPPVNDGPDAPGDASGDGPPGDAPDVPSDATIGVACGNATCTGTQECCIGQNGGECVDEGTCQTVTFECDGPEDCPGEVCCFGAGGPGGGGATCKPANMCQSNACHEDTDCEGNTPSCCPLPQTQYEVCLAQCPP